MPKCRLPPCPHCPSALESPHCHSHQVLGASMTASVVSSRLCHWSDLQPSSPFSEGRGLASLPDKALSVSSWISSWLIKLSVYIQDPSPLSVSGGWPFCEFIVEEKAHRESIWLLAGSPGMDLVLGDVGCWNISTSSKHVTFSLVSFLSCCRWVRPEACERGQQYTAC